jgi:pyruvate/2-oxoglutarate dehydrogenase complex dihydrolipoamide dehydrogenase (E3) component
MSGRRVAVVGGGVAGVSAALAASAQGAKTTLVESSKRVGVSKALMPLLLSDGWTEEDIVLPEAGRLARAGVVARTGEGVTAIRRRGGELRLEAPGRAAGQAFDSVVVCTGSAAQTPPLRGLSKKNVFVMRDVADYLALSGALDSLAVVAVSGPVPLALRLGEALARRGKSARVYCGKDGLERQFSTEVAAAIRRAASADLDSGRAVIVDGSLDSILGVSKAEAVVSGGQVSTCDAVVVVPKSAPSPPIVDCEMGPDGGLLVDSRMATTQPGVFAAGDSAEIRFKSGSVPARLYSTSRTGGEVAGTNSAGGTASAAPSWAFEQTYFGMEFCAAGLSGEEASAVGLEASTETGSVSNFERGSRRETFVSIVYDMGTRRVYGLQVAGWRASSLSSAVSLAVSLGVTVEQLQHVESPYSPGLGHEASPIALTAGKIPKLEGA